MSTVLYQTGGAVATVTLNRPERLNAMNRELIGEAVAALERAASDESIRVLILTGAGRGFCAGGDLAGFADGDFKRPQPIALHRIKQNLNDATRLGFSEALDREADRHSRCSMTEDNTEAAKAFLEKRKPVFKGR